MASFTSSEIDIGYWSSASNRVYCYITGNANRSGTTITLSGMVAHFRTSYTSYGTDGMTVTVNGTQTGFTIGNNNGWQTQNTGLNNTSFTSAYGNTSATVSWGTRFTSDGGTASSSVKVTFDAGITPPTGLSTTNNSVTWNSVNATATITSYGVPASTTGRYVQILLLPSTSTSITDAFASASVSNALTTGEQTLTGNQMYPLVGCTPYKLACYANNTQTSANAINSTVFYTAPYPMKSINVSTNLNDTPVYTTTAIGGTADGTENATGTLVDVEFRYSLDNGATFTAWDTVATGVDPGVGTSLVLTNLAQDLNVVVEARQLANGIYTAATSTSFVTKPGRKVYFSVNGEAVKFNKLYFSVNGHAKELTKLYVGDGNNMARLIFNKE